MKLKLLLLLFIIVSELVCAALPPQYQNMKDLDVIVEFIAQHERILENLRSIDFEEYIVHYGDECVATFERKYIAKLEGWVGPLAMLEFKKSTCSIDY